MAEDNIPGVEEKKGPSLIMIIIIIVVVALVISAGTSFLLIKLLGSNVSQQNTTDIQNSSTVAKTSIAEVIKEGSRSSIMLKGGNDIAVVDALQFKVGSDESKSKVNTYRIEILDAIRMIFLNKTKSELTNPQSIELVKKQIKDVVNEITGFTGEKENLGVVSVNILILAITSAQ